MIPSQSRKTVVCAARQEEEEEDLGSRSLKKIEPGEEHFQTGRINVPSGRR
jgi:hypothetical protein